MTRKPTLVLLFTFLVPLFCSASSDEIVSRLEREGFRCSEKGEAFNCKAASLRTGQVNYPAPVAIIIPKRIQRVEKVYAHFHGHQNVCHGSTIRDPLKMAEAFGIDKPFQSGEVENGIVVAPLSYGKVATFRRHLVPRFGQFANWLKGILDAESAPWRLSGHSAGVDIINKVAERVDVENVLLLDGTYWKDQATLNRWKRIQQRNPGVFFESVYRPGTKTERGSRLLQRTVGSASSQLVKTGGRHCTVPQRHFHRGVAKPASIPQNEANSRGVARGLY